MMKSVRRVTLTLAVLALSGLVIYQGWRVWVAHDRLDTAFAPYRAEGGDLLRWDDLTDWQQNALILVEDPAFFEHSGIDISTPGAGLTSIPQAITKKMFFDDFQPGFAKIEQSLIAHFVVAPNVSKEDQLTAFLNVVYLGRGNGQAVYGFRNAADVFFGKSVADLEQDEFLRLTGALVAPRTFAPVAGNSGQRRASCAASTLCRGGLCA